MKEANNETRTIYYDNMLHLEAYYFEHVKKSFPNHFHEHYVIGFMEDGERILSCKNKEYHISSNVIVLFNPEDNHSCIQQGDRPMYFRGFNISKTTMEYLTKEVTGKKELPVFSTNVLLDEDLLCYLKPLHKMIMARSNEFEKEELLFLIISYLIKKYSHPFDDPVPECREEIKKACEFLNLHYAEAISLEQICQWSNLSKSSLLRAFTKEKGVTPYRYLETIRINKAKKMLEEGKTPTDVAFLTGFSDQSHFTNYFSKFIGLTPKVYQEIFQDKFINNNVEGQEHDE